MSKKKQTIGGAVGRLIDDTLDHIGSVFSRIAAKPGEIVHTLDEENTALGNRAKTLETLRGLGSANIKADNKARALMGELGLTKEDVISLRERYR